MIFFFKQMLKISAFYLEKQKKVSFLKKWAKPTSFVYWPNFQATVASDSKMKCNNLRWLWQPLYNIWKLWKEAVQSRKGRSKRAEWSQLFSRDYHLSSGLKSHGTRHIGVKSFIKSPQWHTYFFDFTRVISKWSL